LFNGEDVKLTRLPPATKNHSSQPNHIFQNHPSNTRNQELNVVDNEKQLKRTAARRDKKARFAVDVEVRTRADEDDLPRRGSTNQWIGGRAWSPGIYRALRSLGKSLDVAWEKAFIRPLTFNN